MQGRATQCCTREAVQLEPCTMFLDINKQSVYHLRFLSLLLFSQLRLLSHDCSRDCTHQHYILLETHVGGLKANTGGNRKLNRCLLLTYLEHSLECLCVRVTYRNTLIRGGVVHMCASGGIWEHSMECPSTVNTLRAKTSLKTQNHTEYMMLAVKRSGPLGLLGGSVC